MWSNTLICNTALCSYRTLQIINFKVETFAVCNLNIIVRGRGSVDRLIGLKYLVRSAVLETHVIVQNLVYLFLRASKNLQLNIVQFLTYNNSYSHQYKFHHCTQISILCIKAQRI